jgi:hypothetical protein
MTCQVLHFIPTPCREINERFCLAVIHHILHHEIKMFAMHPLPPTTQRTYHHLYEINTSAIKEISNFHLMLQPHFWKSVKMTLTLLKGGLRSPPRLPKFQSSIARVKTPRLEAFFVSLESY